MRETLQQFTFGVFDVWEATRTEISRDVWRIDLPGEEEGHAAWFLGRPTGSLLVTFDLDRWEEGTRLECLTLASPLVRRLQQFTEARGVLATVTVQPPDGGGRKFDPYLMARFSGRISGDRVVEERAWLGYNRATGNLVRVSGDPFQAPGLREGEPAEDAERAGVVVEERAALEGLVAAWEDVMSQRQAEFERDARARYEQEAREAATVLTGPTLDNRFKTLGERYALTIETHIEAALRLWRPSR